ncbi:MAG: ATP synthase F1 subunit epsilon [Flavobacteriales bacterium]|nr:ATP synthase F1 subunit epsilon [Flavobacteriales bacterium]
MNVEILTADKSLYTGEVDMATFPGADGSFGVLNNHAPMIASLKAGTIILKSGQQEEKIEVKGGVVEVLHSKVIVLAE